MSAKANKADEERAAGHARKDKARPAGATGNGPLGPLGFSGRKPIHRAHIVELESI